MGVQSDLLSDIRTFLTEAKSLIASGRYDFVPRKKNMQALAVYGLSLADAKADIFELVVSDYYKGPKKDFDSNRPGDIWEFKKEIDGIQFYIKLKITKENGMNILKCIGFHEDNFA